MLLFNFFGPLEVYRKPVVIGSSSVRRILIGSFPLRVNLQGPAADPPLTTYLV